MSLQRLVALLGSLALAGCGSFSAGGTPSAGPPLPRMSRHAGCHARGSGLYALPDRRCTPGATNPDVTTATMNSTVCRAGWTKTVRPPSSVTEPEKRASLRAYGIPGASIHAYEYDHLIPLSLGGAPNSRANLWPELNYPNAPSTTFDHNPKDRLEFALRRRVCDGDMPLATAQKLIASDWASAYKKYA